MGAAGREVILRRAGVPAGSSVPGWSPLGSLHPQLALRVEAPPVETLHALADGLRGTRFRIRDRSDTGFWASHTNWLALFVQDHERTVLRVAVTAAPATELVVDVVSGAEHRSGEALAVQGLAAAVNELRQRGHSVSFSRWEPV